MIEVVILRDMMASFAVTWVPVGTTDDMRQVQRGDIFREVGFGEGAEEMMVSALEVSAIPGGSRLMLERAYHNTKPQTYRVGAVLGRLEPAIVVGPGMKPIPLTTASHTHMDLLSDVEALPPPKRRK